MPVNLKTSVRRLWRSKRLAGAAVLCIAIGTAATSATLTLVSSTLLRPLPFPDAERLVRVWLHEPDGDPRIELSYLDLRDVGEQMASLDAVEAAARARLLFRGAEGTRRVEGEAVSEGYFELLGVEPLVGRRFTAEEHRPGGERVMMLDYRAWGTQFGYDDGVVGRTVRTDEGEHTVVGVLPESFTGSIEEDSGDVEFYLPLEDYLWDEARTRREVRLIWPLGRLAPGTSIEAAAGEAGALARRLAAASPESHRGRELVVEPLGESWRSALRRGGLLALAASILLLLVAAINVAALLLARSIDDRRETAIHAALGAGRGQMLRPVLLEALLLAGAGGGLGLAAGPPLLRALLGNPALVDTAALGIPVFVRLGLDPTAAGLAVLAFLVTAVVAGVGPALVVSRVDPGQALQEGGRAATPGRRAHRWSRRLVLAEVALTTVLVLAAALLLRSYQALSSEDLGFRTEGVLRIALFVDPEDVPADDALPAFWRHVRGELGGVPGVEEAGLVWPTVPIDWPVEVPLTVPGAGGAAGGDDGLRVGLYRADGAFFELLDLPLLAGRGLREGDGAEAPRVAVASASLARRLAGGGDPRSVVGTAAAAGGEPLRIVGVVGDARFGGPRQEPGAAGYALYLPYAQSPPRLMTLLLATPGDPAALLPAVQRRIAELAPASAVDWSGPLDQWVVDLYLLDSRFLLSLVGLFSAACLMLAAVGLFALLAHAVARRGAEMGIRQALGATPGALRRMVVAEGLRLVALGLVLGGAGGWLLGGALESFLWGVGAADPWSFAATAAVLLAVAVAASLLPARRAASTAPAEVLRAG